MNTIGGKAEVYVKIVGKHIKKASLWTGFFYVPQAGLEPALALRRTGFSYHLQLSLLPKKGICGLDFLFTISSKRY
jgi:hypothetical protein